MGGSMSKRGTQSEGCFVLPQFPHHFPGGLPVGTTITGASNSNGVGQPLPQVALYSTWPYVKDSR